MKIGRLINHDNGFIRTLALVVAFIILALPFFVIYLLARGGLFIAIALSICWVGWLAYYKGVKKKKGKTDKMINEVINNERNIP